MQNSGLTDLGILTMLRTYSKEGEDWAGIAKRYLDFMKTVYPHMTRDIDRWGKAIEHKYITPSMRLMQNAGEVALKESARAYNCAFCSPVDFKDFSDISYLLCCGAGVGFSVEDKYVEQLPCVGIGKEETIIIGDDKESWADSWRQLLENPQVRFDYSLIRPAGASLSSGGTASGHEVLKTAHEGIRGVISALQGGRLRSVDVADIICHIAQAIVAGGVRRSALICLYDFDDRLMESFKSGEWFKDNIHRSKANISAIGLKNSNNVRDILYNALNSTYGEPGIMLTSSENAINSGSNPCQPEFATVLKEGVGLCQFKDISIGDRIWDGVKYVTVVNKWATGVKPVYRYTTNKGVFIGTSNHKVRMKGRKIEVDRASFIDYSSGACQDKTIIDPKDVFNGLVFGDGYTHKASNNLPLLIIGDNDKCYFDSEISKFIGRSRSGISKKSYAISGGLTDSVWEAINKYKTYEREIPAEYMFGGDSKKAGFLRGLFSANGCVTAGRVQFKTSCFNQAQQIQCMLGSLGISCSLVINKPVNVKWNNGTYTSKESYNLILYGNSEKFKKIIGFIHPYKNEKPIKDSVTTQTTAKVIRKEFLGDFEVYDITVDSDEHVYWTGNCIVSNCGEISLRNRSFCNLSEVISSNCSDKDDFIYACKAASFFGTLQAGLTNFHYIHKDWKKNAEEEALLGVSITGQAMATHLMTPEILREGAEIVKDINIIAAKSTGINPAKRLTCVKPSGTTSCVFGTTSGIHAAHGEYVIRRIRLAKLSPLGIKLLELYGVPYDVEVKESWFKRIVKKIFRLKPLFKTEYHVSGDKYSFIQQDAYSESDIVLQFPCHYKDAIYRKNETAIELLERMKLVYDNWVVTGHVEGDETNNVSLTVSVKSEEKEEVFNWMLNNQGSYRGISVLPYDGGDYPLLPFEEMEKEEWDKYAAKYPELDFSALGIKADIKGTSACSGGQCEVT